MNDKHWYDKILDAFRIYIPGNDVYRTMRARSARTGTYFIIPFIIGFLLFMAKPMVESFIMSFNDVKLIPGEGYSQTYVGLDNYNTALRVDPEYNTYLVEEVGQMAVNTIATLVVSFVVAVILNQEFKGRTLARAIFFLPVILSSGVLPGIEHQNEFYDMMSGLAQSLEESGGVDLLPPCRSCCRCPVWVPGCST